jgi:hypothetical protein
MFPCPARGKGVACAPFPAETINSCRIPQCRGCIGNQQKRFVFLEHGEGSVKIFIQLAQIALRDKAELLLFAFKEIEHLFSGFYPFDVFTAVKDAAGIYSAVVEQGAGVLDTISAEKKRFGGPPLF